MKEREKQAFAPSELGLLYWTYVKYVKYFGNVIKKASFKSFIGRIFTIAQ